MSYSVAIYIRLSDEDTNKKCKEDESQSIVNQKALLRDFCRDRNWQIHDIYIDENYSGTDSTRPEFNRMLKDCEAREVNLVLCKTQDRFSRDSTIANHYIHDKFIEWGVRFKSIADNIDTNDQGTKKSSQISSLTGEWYCEDTSNKVRSVLKNKRENGQFTGSFAVYGYVVDPDNKNHLLVDPEAAETVKLVFDLYTQGYGYRGIVQELNNRGIPNPTLYKQQHGSKFYNSNIQESPNKGYWTVSTIYTMIRQETYIGTLVQGRSHNVSYKNHKRIKVDKSDWIRVQNAHEAIIDMDVWCKTQERLASRLRTSPVTNIVNPLSGKVRCAVCSAPMKRDVYYNKARTIQYYGLTCATYKTGAMNCANVHRISGRELEAFLVDQINALIQKYCSTDEIVIQDNYDKKAASLACTLKTLADQITSKESKITRAYEDRIDSVITLDQYKIISQKLTDEINDIKARQDAIEYQLMCVNKAKSQQIDKKALINKYIHVDELTREIVEDFIDTLWIGERKENEERQITIDWKI